MEDQSDEISEMDTMGGTANWWAVRFGERVREIRRAQGRSLPVLAIDCAVSKGLLSKIERGTGNPSLTTIHKLASGLGVPVSRLFS